MLEQKVKGFLQRNSFQIEKRQIAVGVSGGPDSLALLHFLWSHETKWGITVTAIHVDHMFRGEESREEALFVQQFCESRSIPVYISHEDVPLYIQQTGKSAQVAARECRYQFFEKIMKEHNIQFLALGHHGDDQIETMLMRLTRGSTGKARAGIPFSRAFSDGYIIRPFLCLKKEEIIEYCLQHSLDARYDSSNEKRIYSRNRFRLDILPFLKNENPQVHEHFQRFSEDITEDEEFLVELTLQKLNTLMDRGSDKIVVDIDQFVKMPMPLQRRGIQLILNYLYTDIPASLSAIHIDQVISLMRNPHPSGVLDFPEDITITKSYRNLQFQRFVAQALTYRFELSKPGTIHLPDGNQISLSMISNSDIKEEPNSLLVDSSEIELPIIIRTRENGDRMTVRGMKGTKKVKDIFIDSKIPKSDRDIWPVVTDSNDQILWLPGLRKSNFTHHKQRFNHHILLRFIKQ